LFLPTDQPVLNNKLVNRKNSSWNRTRGTVKLKERKWRKHERKRLNEREKALAQNKKDHGERHAVPPDPSVHRRCFATQRRMKSRGFPTPSRLNSIRLEKRQANTGKNDASPPAQDRLSCENNKAKAPSKSKISWRRNTSARRIPPTCVSPQVRLLRHAIGAVEDTPPTLSPTLPAVIPPPPRCLATASSMLRRVGRCHGGAVTLVFRRRRNDPPRTQSYPTLNTTSANRLSRFFAGHDRVRGQTTMRSNKLGPPPREASGLKPCFDPNVFSRKTPRRGGGFGFLTHRAHCFMVEPSLKKMSKWPEM